MYLKISRQGLTGARELRKRVRPFRAASFLHRPSGGLELPQAGSPLTGGKFSAEPQRGDSPSADGGNVPRPAAGQEGRHQGFYPLNSHFLLFLSLAQTRDRRPLQNGEQQSGYRSVSFSAFSHFTDSLLLHIWLNLRRVRHDSAAQVFNALYCRTG